MGATVSEPFTERLTGAARSTDAMFINITLAIMFASYSHNRKISSVAQTQDVLPLEERGYTVKYIVSRKVSQLKNKRTLIDIIN